MTLVTHLECSLTGERYEPGQVHNLSRAGKPLLVRYDLDGVKKALGKEVLARLIHRMSPRSGKPKPPPASEPWH